MCMLIIFKYVLQSFMYVNTHYLNKINHRKQSIKLFAHLFMHMLVFCHVEDVARNQQAIEAVQVEEAEEVYPEQQLQESEVAEEDLEFETDLANPDLQQGKHQIRLTQCLTFFKFMQM